MKKAYYLVILLLIASLTNIYAQKRLAVSGTIKQKSTGKTLPRAAVYVVETGYGTVADTMGRYTVLVPKGTYYINFSYQGFFTRRDKITVSENMIYDVELEEKMNELEEVTISANSATQNLKRLETGVTNLSIKNIRKIPTLLGEIDVIKSLFSLPGVASVGEGASGFNVRGGNIDQNLILMDEAPVFNASHLMGFFSVFNPDALRDMNFYRGGIPAQYGGRTASVLNINLKDANAQKLAVSGGLGLVSSRLMIESPIIKDKWSFYVASRFSYVDYLFKLVKNKNVQNTTANFYDITGKTEFRPTKKDKIALTAFTGYDKFRIAGDSLSNFEVNASSSLFSWKTTTSTLSWSHFFNDKFTSKIAGVYSRYDANIEIPDSSFALKLPSNIIYKSVKADFDYQLGKKQKIGFGGAAIDYDIDPGSLIPVGSASQINAKLIPKENALEAGVYVNDEIEISKKFSVMIGARYSWFGNKGASTIYNYRDGFTKSPETISDSTVYGAGEFTKTFGGIEPRFSAKFSINDQSSIKFSLNRMRQYIQLISNTTSALPTARWKTSDNYLNPQIADQISLGYFQNLKDNKIEASLEVFYKKLQGVTDYKDGARLLLERYPETIILQGIGYAYGAELYIKKNIGLLTGWLSYTYSNTQFLIDGKYIEDKINNGKYYPPNYNKPHIMNVVASYQVSKRVSFSSNFTYSTGRPLTYPEAKGYIANIVFPYYTNRNQDKIPDYIRLDLAMNIEPNSYSQSRFKHSWNVSFYNLLNRRNAYSIFFRTKNRYGSYYNKVDIYKLSILGSIIPSITYNFKF